MDQAAMDTAEDGSASPESTDENLTDIPASEDQSLSKNRSKRKPSKTQIKHIAQGTVASNGQNGHQAQSDGPQNQHLEKRKSGSHSGSANKNEKCDTSKYGTQNIEDLFNDVTQGIYRDSHIQQPARPRRSKKMAKTEEHLSNVASPSSGRPAPCYPCGICGKVFRVPSRYDSHMLGHSKGKPFCCTTCGKMFISQDKLDRHLPVHNCDRHAAFTCDACGKVCVNWRAYLYHMKAKHTESGGKRFSCNLCGRQFHSGQRLRNHMSSHEVGKNHCCHVCGKLFESNKKLAIHSLVHNLSSMHDQNLHCTDCGRQYTEWIAFKQHMKTHGTEGVHYPCGICGETFATQYEKEKHKRVHKQVQCGVCHRYFRSSSVLSVHLRIHTGEKPYNCGLCEKEFSQLSVMKIHMRAHGNDGRYDCRICTAIFSDVMDYFKHYVAHFEDGNLQCEICNKVFDSTKKKNRHMAAHQDRTGRQCPVCGKEFGRVSHLEAHMLCHSDQLPLMCKVCGKMFSSEDVLTAHYSSHVKPDASEESAVTSEGPLFCGLCGKMFKDQEYLNKHMKRHESMGQDIKREDTALDEDIVEIQNGQFTCKDCGKRYDVEDHIKVHRREHTGERPHICVMCGESFTLRKSLFEHGLTHKHKDLINSSSHQLKAGSNDNFKSLTSSSKRCGESDSGSSSETDTDCDHEENVRQSRGKPQKNNSGVDSSNKNLSCVSNTVANTVQPIPVAHSSSIYSSHQQDFPMPQIGNKFSKTNASTSSFPTLTNTSDSEAVMNQMQEHFPYGDIPIPMTHNSTHSSLSMNMRMLRPEVHMPIGMHMPTHQDLKTDVSHPIPLSYSRAYMTPPSMSNVPPHHRPSLPHNFHGPSARFHPDLHHNSLPNFQLLPQTAFHEQTYHM